MTFAALFAALLASAGTTQTTATGGWQGATWGMTRDEARASLRIPVASVREIPGTFSSPALRGAYVASGFQFTATLNFDPRGRLARVTLDVDRGFGCGGVELLLTDRYGQPYRNGNRDDYVDLGWRDEAGSNIVTFMSSPWPQTESGRSCVIFYSPLIGEDSGL